MSYSLVELEKRRDSITQQIAQLAIFAWFHF